MIKCLSVSTISALVQAQHISLELLQQHPDPSSHIQYWPLSLLNSIHCNQSLLKILFLSERLGGSDGWVPYKNVYMIKSLLCLQYFNEFPLVLGQVWNFQDDLFSLADKISVPPLLLFHLTLRASVTLKHNIFCTLHCCAQFKSFLSSLCCLTNS